MVGLDGLAGLFQPWSFYGIYLQLTFSAVLLLEKRVFCVVVFLLFFFLFWEWQYEGRNTHTNLLGKSDGSSPDAQAFCATAYCQLAVGSGVLSAAVTDEK